jgi:hypothetical protein
MQSLLQAIWPGILGAFMTGFLIYMSLRDVTTYGARLVVLKWRAQDRESTDGEASTSNQQRG